MKRGLRLLTFVAVAMVCSVASAQMTDEQKEMFLRKTGGMVEIPGKGFLAVINEQAKVSEAEVRSCVRWLEVIANIQCRYVGKDTVFDVRRAKQDLESSGANAALFIADDEMLPMSLYAPEGKWSMVNAAAFDLTDMGVFTNRFEKEVFRAAGLLLGTAVSQVPESVMKPVFSEKDLDTLTGETWMNDAFPGLFAKIDALGMTPNGMISYRKACLQGIAPPPSNDYQRVIWDGVKDGAIKFKKKGESK